MVYPNGTVEILKNKYTREQLQTLREENNVVSVEHHPGNVIYDDAAEFVKNMTERETGRPVC